MSQSTAVVVPQQQLQLGAPLLFCNAAAAATAPSDPTAAVAASAAPRLRALAEFLAHAPRGLVYDVALATPQLTLPRWVETEWAAITDARLAAEATMAQAIAAASANPTAAAAQALPALESAHLPLRVGRYVLPDAALTAAGASALADAANAAVPATVSCGLEPSPNATVLDATGLAAFAVAPLGPATAEKAAPGTVDRPKVNRLFAGVRRTVRVVARPQPPAPTTVASAGTTPKLAVRTATATPSVVDLKSAASDRRRDRSPTATQQWDATAAVDATECVWRYHHGTTAAAAGASRFQPNVPAAAATRKGLGPGTGLVAATLLHPGTWAPPPQSAELEAASKRHGTARDALSRMLHHAPTWAAVEPAAERRGPAPPGVQPVRDVVQRAAAAADPSFAAPPAVVSLLLAANAATEEAALTAWVAQERARLLAASAPAITTTAETPTNATPTADGAAATNPPTATATPATKSPTGAPSGAAVSGGAAEPVVPIAMRTHAIAVSQAAAAAAASAVTACVAPTCPAYTSMRDAPVQSGALVPLVG